MRRLGLLLLLAFLAVTLFGVVTWFALEGHDVAVLRTRTSEGAWRETRVWVAEVEGSFWVESATPERPWYRDVQRDPRIELVHRGVRALRVVEPHPGEAGHRRIRRWLSEKYGWADTWVGLLQDTSRSVAVRLGPAA